MSPTRVALYGWDERGRFAWEVFRQRADADVVLIAEDDPELRTPAASITAPTPVVAPVELLDRSTEWDLLWVATGAATREHWIEAAIAIGKHVRIEPPLATSVATAKRWETLAVTSLADVATVVTPLGDGDFAAALHAVRTGRLGAVRAARLTVAEYALEAGPHAPLIPRGTTFAVCHPFLCEQLAALIETPPSWIAARSFPDEEGYAVEYDWNDGRCARIEVRRGARATLRTGWMLEGTAAAYHQQRLYSSAPDGELLDEPWPAPEVNDAATPLATALRACGLYHAAAHSLATGQPLAWSTIWD